MLVQQAYRYELDPNDKVGGALASHAGAARFGVVDVRHVRLPRIGAVRTKEPTSTLSRLLDTGEARILSATVKEQAGRWYVSFCCEVERAESATTQTVAKVGVDVGVACLAVCSTLVPGVTDADGRVANPKHLSRWQRRQARLQAELSRRHGPGRDRAPVEAVAHNQGSPGSLWCQCGQRQSGRPAQAHHRARQLR